jgi:hypothetical protein
MGFKTKIKGLSENEIKKFVKISIISGYSKRILKSKSLKKNSYLQEIVEEATIELEDFMNFIDNNIDCPEEKLTYLYNHLK